MVGSLLYHGFIMGFGLLLFYPVLWLISSSVKGQAEIFQNAHTLIPQSLHLENYIQGWRGFIGVNFGVFFKNSFIISITSTLGQLINASLVAYGFARIKFFAKNIWFAIMIATLLLPSQVLMIPQYLLFSHLKWIDTFWPIILPSFFSQPFFIFLMFQFIQGLPSELDEAAKIDGCGRFSIYWRIILPNITPALITGGIFSFYWTWNNFFQALLYIQSVQKYPVSFALQLFSDASAQTQWGPMFAMSVCSLIPIFVIFITLQRNLVEGISTTGIKG